MITEKQQAVLTALVQTAPQINGVRVTYQVGGYDAPYVGAAVQIRDGRRWLLVANVGCGTGGRSDKEVLTTVTWYGSGGIKDLEVAQRLSAASQEIIRLMKALPAVFQNAA